MEASRFQQILFFFYYFSLVFVITGLSGGGGCRYPNVAILQVTTKQPFGGPNGRCIGHQVGSAIHPPASPVGRFVTRWRTERSAGGVEEPPVTSTGQIEQVSKKLSPADCLGSAKCNRIRKDFTSFWCGDELVRAEATCCCLV